MAFTPEMARPKSKSAGTAQCPICSRPTDAAYRPFCSRRCADVDLGRWLSGSYAIPVTHDEEDEDGGPGAGEEQGNPSGPGKAH